MPFIPPFAEQQFLLRTLSGIDRLGETERFASAQMDMVDAILEAAGDFASREWRPLLRRGDQVGAKWTTQGVVMPEGYAEAYAAYVAGGWGTIGAPEKFGGQGLPFSVAIAVQENLGIANPAFALAPMLTMGAVEALVHHGSPSQQQAWLPHLVSGRWTGTMNLTESQAGSDVGALRAIATPRGDGTWSIRGTKIFISYGDHDLAENIVHLVLARTPGAPSGTKGISLFLVPKFRLNPDGSPGTANDVRVVSIEHKLGLHASPTCVLSFGDEGDCVGELIGPELGGMKAMFTMMNSARLHVGLQGVQIAEAASQLATDFANSRIQSARAGSNSREPVPIIRHPDVRRMLMRMKALTQAARALVYYTAAQADLATLGDQRAHDRLELLTPLAKAYATDIGCEVASLGIQVHGGMGYIEETGAAQFLRDSRIMPIYEGTNGIQAADLVGRKLGMQGGETLAALLAEMRSEAEDDGLQWLIKACSDIAAEMMEASLDDRLAGSYPFLTMLATAVCGWLMEKQSRAASAGQADPDFAAAKRAFAGYFLGHALPEALGLHASASSPAGIVYSLSDDILDRY